jgi:hypothetical protein
MLPRSWVEWRQTGPFFRSLAFFRHLRLDPPAGGNDDDEEDERKDHGTLRSLPDAEAAEDAVEQVVGVDRPDHFSKLIEREPQFKGE